MQTDTLLTPEDAILIPADVLGSDDPDDIIGANIDVLNALFSEYLGIGEVSREALVSYYVDYYLALCSEAGQELEQVTAGDPSHEYQGHTVLAWHFLTDRGHHFMVDSPAGRAPALVAFIHSPSTNPGSGGRWSAYGPR